MNTAATNLNDVRTTLAGKALRIVFILYLLVSGYAMTRHEIWTDEVHSWNIAKASPSYSDLITNKRYEGHPPGWYTILWGLSKFTHDVRIMQTTQWIIACTIVFILLFYSPFPLPAKILIPFGYYFMFEYGVFSRNYAIGVLLAFSICYILRKEFKYKLILYYTLLFCLLNIHLITVLLAGSLHLYFLMQNWKQKKKKSELLVHSFLGLAFAILALHFLIPPSDGQLGIHFLVDGWKNSSPLKNFFAEPLRCFLPVPAWWLYNFWNTEFLLEAAKTHALLNFINPIISLTLLASFIFVLRKNKKCLALFSANILFSLIITLISFSLSTARYAGFMYIGFIVSWWLYCAETAPTKNDRQIVNALLIIQLIAGIFAVTKDIRLPFSNLSRIEELIKEIPADDKMVTDYWTMNGIVAFTDKPVYCIDTREEMSFVLWNSDLAAMQKDPARYASGFYAYFSKVGIKKAYMISTHDPSELFDIDRQLFLSFRVDLIDKREGAIENGSNLYLYKIKVD